MSVCPILPVLVLSCCFSLSSWIELIRDRRLRTQSKTLYSVNLSYKFDKKKCYKLETWTFVDDYIDEWKMLQIETQGASELASFRQKPTAVSLSTRQLRRNEGGKGRLEKKHGGGGLGGEGRVESKPSGETANVAEAQNDATENSLEVPASHRWNRCIALVLTLLKLQLALRKSKEHYMDLLGNTDCSDNLHCSNAVGY